MAQPRPVACQRPLDAGFFFRQSPPHRVRVACNGHQEIPGRRIGLRPVLLPIPQRGQFKPELQGELLLRHVHVFADRPDIDLGGRAIEKDRNIAGGQFPRERVDALDQRQLDDRLAAVEQARDDAVCFA
jgi:hypothetical protein